MQTTTVYRQLHNSFSNIHISIIHMYMCLCFYKKNVWEYTKPRNYSATQLKIIILPLGSTTDESHQEIDGPHPKCPWRVAVERRILTRSSVQLINRANSSSHSFEDNGNDDSSDNHMPQCLDKIRTMMWLRRIIWLTICLLEPTTDLMMIWLLGMISMTAMKKSQYLEITDMEFVDEDMEVVDVEVEVVDEEMEHHTQPLQIHLPQLVWIL